MWIHKLWFIAWFTSSVLTPFSASAMVPKCSSEYGLPFSDVTTGITSAFGNAKKTSSIFPCKCMDKWGLQKILRWKKNKNESLFVRYLLPQRLFSVALQNLYRSISVVSLFLLWILVFFRYTSPTMRNYCVFQLNRETIFPLD